MRYFLIICLAMACSGHVAAQQDAMQLYESAKILMRQGEYETATTVMLKAIGQDSVQLDMQKDLAYLYLLQRNYPLALKTARPLIDRQDADVQTFQILGMCYKAVANYSECGILYKYALLKFPTSGVIYNEYGELKAMQNELDQAIDLWEKGIENDPNHSSNYYNATMYYALHKKWWRVLLYGEYFLNLESYTARTETIKSKLTNAYQVLMQVDGIKNTDVQRPFEKALSKAFAAQGSGIQQVFNMASLLDVRTKFLQEWNKESAIQYPLRLNDHLQQLIKEGYFEAYHQWIFGEAINPAEFKQWLSGHTKEWSDFKNFQQGRVFKVPAHQYYNGK